MPINETATISVYTTMSVKLAAAKLAGEQRRSLASWIAMLIEREIETAKVAAKSTEPA